MSYPEGPTAVEQSHDETDATDPAPTDGAFASVLRSIRAHLDTWSRRYVEMRVDARTGRRGQ
ncbi:hypothetical protein [Haloarcula sediminis]|uniref:hypothetical protein n=1 Tax=Haloarcula sediminis TaxID=3111777 RepID=UPI002D78AA15|nr:hypothetical protein [Haloarcula sp. CK38]